MSKRENDIKAPDGFLLGGLRRVRQDGTILFQRGWWKAPDEWIGQDVWVHYEELRSNSNQSGCEIVVEAAPPGKHIHTARLDRTAVICRRTEREDAKLGWRRPELIAWANRDKNTAQAS